MNSLPETSFLNKKRKPDKNHFWRGLTRNVFVLGLVSFLNDVSSEMIYPLLPIFLTTTLGASAEMLGLIEGIAESTAALLKLFSGWLSDKLGKRKFIIIAGYSLSTVTRPLMAMAQAGWHILFIRFSDRVGKGIRTSPRDALIADSVDQNARGKAFGFHRALDHAGAIVGPLLAMVILVFWQDDYRLVFWLAVIPACAGVVLLTAGAKDILPVRTSRLPAIRLSAFDRNFRFYLVTIIIFTLGNSSDAFLLLRAKSLGVSISLLPLIWIVVHIVKMLSSVPGGVISDKIGRRKTIVTGWAIYAMVYAGFAFAFAQWHAWVLFAVYGLYFGLTEGAEKAFVTDLVNPGLRGTAFGVFNFAIGIAAFPSSLIMGILWHRQGPAVAFMFGAAMALTATVLIFNVREGGMDA